MPKLLWKGLKEITIFVKTIFLVVPNYLFSQFSWRLDKKINIYKTNSLALQAGWQCRQMFSIALPFFVNKWSSSLIVEIEPKLLKKKLQKILFNLYKPIDLNHNQC